MSSINKYVTQRLRSWLVMEREVTRRHAIFLADQLEARDRRILELEEQHAAIVKGRSEAAAKIPAKSGVFDFETYNVCATYSVLTGMKPYWGVDLAKPGTDRTAIHKLPVPPAPSVGLSPYADKVYRYTREGSKHKGAYCQVISLAGEYVNVRWLSGPGARYADSTLVRRAKFDKHAVYEMLYGSFWFPSRSPAPRKFEVGDRIVCRAAPPCRVASPSRSSTATVVPAPSHLLSPANVVWIRRDNSGPTWIGAGNTSWKHIEPKYKKGDTVRDTVSNRVGTVTAVFYPSTNRTMVSVEFRDDYRSVFVNWYHEQVDHLVKVATEKSGA